MEASAGRSGFSLAKKPLRCLIAYFVVVCAPDYLVLELESMPLQVVCCTLSCSFASWVLQGCFCILCHQLQSTQ